MYRCGLSVADFNTYLAFLRSPSVGANTRATLLDMSASPLEQVGPILGGQVNIDTTVVGQATRNATVVISDPGHLMGWDSNSPSSSIASIDRMIRLEHVTYVPALGHRVVCPLITGPIRGFTRTGTQVTLTIAGRDDLMLGNAWRPRTYSKGQLKTDVLTDLLEFYGGVGSPNLPSLGARLPAHLSLARITNPWTTTAGLAESLNRQLYYNGGGDPQLRPHPARPVITLFESDQGLKNSDILGETQVSYSLSTGWFNAVQVVGATPQIQAFALPHISSPLHPSRMNGNGAWTVRMTEEQNAHFRSVSEAQARANLLMAQQEAQQVQVTAVSKLIPCLEELDLVLIRSKSGDISFRLTKASIDLASTSMSLGFHTQYHRRRNPRPVHHKKSHHSTHHTRRH